MTYALRTIETDTDIAASFPAMKELRPHLPDAAEFVTRVRRQFAEGYRLLAAWEGPSVVGLAGYRMTENLIRGRFCYVDDLVVLASERRSGLGALLLDGVAAAARAEGVGFVVLDTRLDNQLGQRFYFRYGMLPMALHFSKPLV
jgi:ribosomal protein S18 acetylase RimI-like enzyme